jgi:hypothetical protein
VKVKTVSDEWKMAVTSLMPNTVNSLVPGAEDGDLHGGRQRAEKRERGEASLESPSHLPEAVH